MIALPGCHKLVLLPRWNFKVRVYVHYWQLVVLSESCKYHGTGTSDVAMRRMRSLWDTLVVVLSPTGSWDDLGHRDVGLLF